MVLADATRPRFQTYNWLMQSLELKIMPPIVTVITAALTVIVSLVTPALQIPIVARVLLAVLIFALGGVCAVGGFRAFGRARTTTDPTAPQNASSLVTSGIYTITRNPMYLGMLLVLVAIAVLLANPWCLLGPVAYIFYITRFQIMPEERILTAKFGADYTSFMTRVRRWI